MKRLAAGVAMALALAAGPVCADTMESSYGNTVVVTYPNGAVARYHFNADNTFSVTLPDGSTSQGAYAINGDQICFTQAGETQCTGYVGGKNVGDTWTQTASDGSTVTVSIEAGR